MPVPINYFNLSDIHNQLEKYFPLAFPKRIQ
jgi:hypothetical protein